MIGIGADGIDPRNVSGPRIRLWGDLAGLAALSHDNPALAAADDVLDLGALVAGDDENCVSSARTASYSRRELDRLVQSSSPHSQTRLSTPSRPSQAAPLSRRRSLRARKRTSFSANRRSRACTRPTLRRYRSASRGKASEWPPDSTGGSWSCTCRQASERSARRAASSTGSRLWTATADVRFAVRLLVSELFTNAVKYGSRRADARIRLLVASTTPTSGRRSATPAAASPKGHARCPTSTPSRAEGSHSSTRSRPLGRRPQRRDAASGSSWISRRDARELLLEAGAVADRDRRREHPLEQRCLRLRVVPGVHQLHDGRVCLSSAEPLDRIAGGDLTWLEHADVEARPARVREALDPVRLAHPRREGRTRNARRGHLEKRVADPEPVADPNLVGTEARQRQVLAERPRLRSVTELSGPPRVVLGAIEVESLIGPAVMLRVRDDVAGEAERSGVSVPDRPLADPGRDGAGADRHLLGAARVDRVDPHQARAGSKRSFARFRSAGTRVG